MRFIRSISILTILLGTLTLPLRSQTQRIAFSDPSGPKRLEIKLMTGSIHIKSADVQEVILETEGSKEIQVSGSTKYPGMKQYKAGGGIQVSESDNTVTIKADMLLGGPTNFAITVPRKIDMNVSLLSGDGVEVEGVEGKLDVKVLNGSLILKDVAGAVVAHCLNQSIVASFSRIDPKAAMSFTSLNGNVDVTFPANLAAEVVLKSLQGEIVSDFDIQIEKEQKPSSEVRGRINKGGPLVRLESFNGDVILRRKK